MREPHYRRGQDCNDVIGLPVSGRPWTTADGRSATVESERERVRSSKVAVRPVPARRPSKKLTVNS